MRTTVHLWQNDGWLWPLLFWLVLPVGFVAVALWANQSLWDTPAFLHMDEQVTVLQMLDAYASEGVADFVWKVWGGYDHRYGRLHWATHVVVGWVPYQLLGAGGAILSARLLSAVALLAASLLICKVLVPDARWRVPVLGVLLAAQTTAYYATMPKPEPLQLLALTLWFAALLRGRGPWQWAWAGVAVGLKVSAVPIVGVVAGLWLLSQWPRRAKPDLRLWARRLLWAFLGFVVAAPGFLGHPIKWVLLQARAAAHGPSAHRVYANDWLAWIADGGYLPHAALAVVWAALCAEAVLWVAKHWRQGAPTLRLPAAVLAAGVLSGALIVVGVHRLWTFYLHPALFLAVPALVGLWLQMPARRSALRNALLGLMLGGMLWTGVRSSGPLYAQQAQRHSAATHQRQLARWHHANRALDSLQVAAPGQLPATVYYNPNLYIPQVKSPWVAKPYWGAFKHWGERPAVVLCRQADLAQFQALASHLADGLGRCGAPPCYRLQPIAADSLAILVQIP